MFQPFTFCTKACIEKEVLIRYLHYSIYFHYSCNKNEQKLKNDEKALK